MFTWEKRIHRKYPEEKFIVHVILDRWIPLLMKGHPVPAPETKWQRIAAEGFAIFVEGLRSAGAQFSKASCSRCFFLLYKIYMSSDSL